MIIDSHSHLFSEEFDDDLPQVIERAKAAGITHIFMPNIDSSSINGMLHVAEKYKNYCFPMMGLHPTSVKEDYKSELAIISEYLKQPNRFVAIGEIGLDLYWDKTYLKEQQFVFDQQLQWALEYDLPVVIHSRESTNEIINILSKYKSTPLKGIFHSFTGMADDAKRLLEFDNFMIGINGVVTFKKSHLPIFIKDIPLSRLVLETDSPYLAPTPMRGKRNESAYLSNILLRLAEIYALNKDEIANITSKNSLKVFDLDKYAF